MIIISLIKSRKELKDQLTSPKWKELVKLDNEIEQVNNAIADNINLLKEIKHMKRRFLKELKPLYKNNSLTKKQYLEEKKYIDHETEKKTDQVLEELTYNTSFITKKYDDLASLQDDEKITDINKKHKAALKELSKEAKQQRKLINAKIRKLIFAQRFNKVSKAEVKELKSLKKEQKLFEKELKSKKKKAQDNFIKSSKSLKYRTIALSLMIGVPLLMLIGLLVNYLVYFPLGRHKDFSFNSSTVFPFVISMVMIVLIIGVTMFFVMRNTRRIVVDREQKTAKLMSIGFIASFFDVLGVGCFATSLGLLKATKSFDDDKMIPGTLNMAFCVPILMEGSFLVSATAVDVLTLVLLVACAVAGSYFGAILVNIFNEQIVKIVISIALFAAGIIMIMTTSQVGVIPAGQATGLHGWRLGIGVIGFLLIGVLMSFGVGSYAPAMVILSLLGMNPVSIAPIMMCSSAFLMPVTSYKYYKDNNYLPKSALLMMLGGVFGSTISFIFFYIGVQVGMGLGADSVAYQSIIKWLTIAVMFYSSITMFLEFINNTKHGKEKLETKKTKKVVHLDDLLSIKELNETINSQLAKLMSKDAQPIDTKKRVIEKDIPINSWINPSDNVQEKIDKQTSDNKSKE